MLTWSSGSISSILNSSSFSSSLLFIASKSLTCFSFGSIKVKCWYFDKICCFLSSSISINVHSSTKNWAASSKYLDFFVYHKTYYPIPVTTSLIKKTWSSNFYNIEIALKLVARGFQYIVQITLFQLQFWCWKLQFWCWKLQFLIQYRKFPITVGPNLYGTGSKIEVFNIKIEVEKA